MGRLGRGLAGLIGGYVAGALAGLLLVSALSGNTHDRSLELVTTAMLVTGPIGGLIGMLAGLVSGKGRTLRGPRE